jgi:hypothetical protein
MRAVFCMPLLARVSGFATGRLGRPWAAELMKRLDTKDLFLF